ncbi:Tn3 family transposase [Streptomyces canus]|uniref:Tn3 family transposase n=1 Tax=Streptomyces canus TaxID=58343 RepID=UPI003F4BF627
MEDSLGTLGLALNAIVLFNTFYMDQIIKRMRERGLPVFPQDVAQLSPFTNLHINMKGRYAFELPDLPDGLMRSLPEPE